MEKVPHTSLIIPCFSFKFSLTLACLTLCSAAPVGLPYFHVCCAGATDRERFEYVKFFRYLAHTIPARARVRCFALLCSALLICLSLPIGELICFGDGLRGRWLRSSSRAWPQGAVRAAPASLCGCSVRATANRSLTRSACAAATNAPASPAAQPVARRRAGRGRIARPALTRLPPPPPPPPPAPHHLLLPLLLPPLLMRLHLPSLLPPWPFRPYALPRLLFLARL
jgi:hypothetical protein